MSNPRQTPLWSTIPPLTQGALARYFDKRIAPGGFVRLLLENNGLAAVAVADDEHYEAIPAILRWLYEYAPTGAYGSPARVDAWLEEAP